MGSCAGGAFYRQIVTTTAPTVLRPSYYSPFRTSRTRPSPTTACCRSSQIRTRSSRSTLYPSASCSQRSTSGCTACDRRSRLRRSGSWRCLIDSRRGWQIRRNQRGHRAPRVTLSASTVSGAAGLGRGNVPSSVGFRLTGKPRHCVRHRPSTLPSLAGLSSAVTGRSRHLPVIFELHHPDLPPHAPNEQDQLVLAVGGWSPPGRRGGGAESADWAAGTLIVP